MAFRLLNRVQMSVAGTPGTGDVTLSGATTGFQSFSAAGASDGDTVPYLIEDGNAWEIGVGTYHSSGTTFSRNTLTQSSTGSKLSLTSAAIVSVALRGQDVSSSGSSVGGWLTAGLTSSTSNYAGLAWNKGATVTLAAGDRLEIEGYIYADTHSVPCGIGVFNDSTVVGYDIVAQSDGNYVPYRVEDASNQTTWSGASGSDSIHQWDGLHYFKLTVIPDTTTNNILRGITEEWDTGKVHDTNINLIGSTLTIASLTPDITKCSMRFRIVPQDGTAF